MILEVPSSGELFLLWTQAVAETHKEGGHRGKGGACREVERTQTSAWGLAWPSQGQPHGGPAATKGKSLHWPRAP